MANDNHIHEEDGKWYFWDETEAHREGPYATREVAVKAMERYCEVMLRDKPEDIIFAMVANFLSQVWSPEDHAKIAPGVTMDQVREVAFKAKLDDQGLPDGSVKSPADYKRYHEGFVESSEGQWLFMITPPDADAGPGAGKIFIAFDFENGDIHTC